MAQRVNRLLRMGTWHAPPRSRRYAPLSDAAKYPAGARPSKCIIINVLLLLFTHCWNDGTIANFGYRAIDLTGETFWEEGVSLAKQRFPIRP
jgi:hypothetical protein